RRDGRGAHRKSATGIRNTVVWKKLFKFQRDGVDAASPVSGQRRRDGRGAHRKSATGIRNTVVWKKLFKFQRDGV
ncbi:hypothetical protein ACLXAZ_33520, partial [Escherichia coli]